MIYALVALSVVVAILCVFIVMNNNELERVRRRLSQMSETITMDIYKLKHTSNKHTQLFVSNGEVLTSIQKWRETVEAAIDESKKIPQPKVGQIVSANFRVREVR